VESNEKNRRAYRDLLFTTEGIATCVSGVILYEETMGQNTLLGDVPFPKFLAQQGIVPGIKLDQGLCDLALCPGEKITKGLDTLRGRLHTHCNGEGRALARFAKWRAVIQISDTTPSETCIQANAHSLGRFAALCQEASVVPVVEPEILYEGGAHSIESCRQVTEATLGKVFDALKLSRVDLRYTILKASMVIPGKLCPIQAEPEEIASQTIECLMASVPPEVPGIVFLSGGQDDEGATKRLNAMVARGGVPWRLSFSYSRALHDCALRTWRGLPERVADAQTAFFHRARMNSLAAMGQYSDESERGA